MRLHERDGHSRFCCECDGCDKNFRNLNDPRLHEKDVHSRFCCECYECDKNFGNPNDLRLHEKDSHDDSLVTNLQSKAPKKKVHWDPNISNKMYKTSIGSEYLKKKNRDKIIKKGIWNMTEKAC